MKRVTAIVTLFFLLCGLVMLIGAWRQGLIKL